MKIHEDRSGGLCDFLSTCLDQKLCLGLQGGTFDSSIPRQPGTDSLPTHQGSDFSHGVHGSVAHKVNPLGIGAPLSQDAPGVHRRNKKDPNFFEHLLRVSIPKHQLRQRAQKGDANLRPDSLEAMDTTHQPQDRGRRIRGTKGDLIDWQPQGVSRVRGRRAMADDLCASEILEVRDDLFDLLDFFKSLHSADCFRVSSQLQELTLGALCVCIGANPRRILMELKSLLAEMWRDYSTLNPAAKSIHDLIQKEGETVLNDHVAYRTYRHPKLGLERLEKLVEGLGYKAGGEYHFKEKKLYARHYEHADTTLPKIFVSELLLEHFSAPLQNAVSALIEQVPADFVNSPSCLVAGRPWKTSFANYEMFAKESEYAAWMSAFGFRPNHFTVNVNALKKFPNLETLNTFLQDHGHKLNSSGGLIKGSREAMLEQSSTMAEHVAVEFTDGTYKIPACYYEFALRYPEASGKLYQGFVEKSADKIFESTNRA